MTDYSNPDINFLLLCLKIKIRVYLKKLSFVNNAKINVDQKGALYTFWSNIIY